MKLRTEACPRAGLKHSRRTNWTGGKRIRHEGLHNVHCHQMKGWSEKVGIGRIISDMGICYGSRGIRGSHGGDFEEFYHVLSAICCFIALLIVRLWKWRRHIPPKHCFIPHPTKENYPPIYYFGHTQSGKPLRLWWYYHCVLSPIAHEVVVWISI